MGKAKESISNKNFSDRYLFISLGALDAQYNKDKKTERAINEFISIIRMEKPSGLKLDYRVYETHGHCPEPSNEDGLKWILNTGYRR